MAQVVEYIAGFETGDLNEADATGGTVAVSTSNLRSGAYNMRTNPTLTAVGWGRFGGLAAAGTQGALGITTGFMSVFAYIVTAPAILDEAIVNCYTGASATTLKLSVRLTSARVLAVYDSTNTLVATGTTVIPLNTQTRIDVKAANGTTAAYEVKINEVSELSGTCNQGANTVGCFYIGKPTNTNGQSVDIYYDDIWIDSGQYAPSNYKIVVDKPTANGATMSWTGGTNTSDYTQVNNIPIDTAKYIKDPAGTSLPVIANFVMQTYAAMGITAGSTITVLKSFGFSRDDATVTNTFQQGLLSNATYSLTNASNTSAANVTRQKIHQTDPNTSAAWGQAGVEAVQRSDQEGTTAVNTRESSALIMIGYVPGTASTVKQLSALGVG